MTTPEIAIVHDFLTSRGGAERVVLALAETFPGASIHTALFEPRNTYREFSRLDVRPSPLNRIRAFRANHRLALPVLPAVFRSMRVQADVTVCSSAGFSHQVTASGRKVVYCHTPPRWLYDPERYLRSWGPSARSLAGLLRHRFVPMDRRAMVGADRVLANSTAIAREIARLYATEPVVVAPCSSLAIEGPAERLAGLAPGFILCPSRALGYKRLDLLVGAARALPDRRFVHVGGGPHEELLRRDAPANLTCHGSVDDRHLRWAYRHADAVVLTCDEDFGLVPLEAHAHGLASVVPRGRGLVDHVSEATLGHFYESGSVTGLVAALRAVQPPTNRGRHPERLGRERFRDAITSEVLAVAS